MERNVCSLQDLVESYVKARLKFRFEQLKVTNDDFHDRNIGEVLWMNLDVMKEPKTVVTNFVKKETKKFLQKI